MLNISKKENGSVLEIKLSGVVDESSDFTNLIGIPAPYAEFHFNTKDVSRINSAGVKRWISYFISLRKSGKKVHFLETSPAILTQANLVHEFISRDEVISLVASYYCGACEVSQAPVFTPADLQKTSFEPPPVLCSKCGKAMEFDDVPEEYFSMWLSD